MLILLAWRAGDTYPLADFLLDKDDFPAMKFDGDIKQYESAYDDQSFPTLVGSIRDMAACWGWQVSEQEV
jgi:hypothetical protein